MCRSTACLDNSHQHLMPFYARADIIHRGNERCHRPYQRFGTFDFAGQCQGCGSRRRTPFQLRRLRNLRLRNVRHNHESSRLPNATEPSDSDRQPDSQRHRRCRRGHRGVATLYPANGTKARLPYGSRYRMTRPRHAHVVADCRDSGFCTFADNYETYSALNRSAASFRLIRFV